MNQIVKLKDDIEKRIYEECEKIKRAKIPGSNE